MTGVHHDRHVREVHGHVVDGHRMAVLQPDPAAAAPAGSDAAVARVKHDGVIEQSRTPLHSGQASQRKCSDGVLVLENGSSLAAARVGFR
jgi:hypothetical protein